MGLDNYWKDGDKDGTVKGEFLVCGGICSGNGNESFRGKVYSGIIEAVTGTSLYEDEIPNSEVLRMNEAIQACTLAKAQEHSPYGIEQEEWDDFKKMWDAHAKAGHRLIAWY